MHGGAGSPRYGCGISHRNGLTACSNRLTIRAKVADAHLLAGLQAELLHPDTLRFSVDLLTRRLNAQIDHRPQLLAEAQTARRRVSDRLQRFIHAIGEGVPPGSLTEAIAEHQAELARLDTELAELAEPWQERLAVIPSWVEGQLRQVAELLTTNTPERTKTEFLRLGLRVVLHPIHEAAARPFYRAVGEAILPASPDREICARFRMLLWIAWTRNRPTKKRGNFASICPRTIRSVVETDAGRLARLRKSDPGGRLFTRVVVAA